MEQMNKIKLALGAVILLAVGLMIGENKGKADGRLSACQDLLSTLQMAGVLNPAAACASKGGQVYITIDGFAFDLKGQPLK